MYSKLAGLVLVVFALTLPALNAKAAGGEQDVLQTLAGEFSTRQLDELSSAAEDAEDAARLTRFMQSLSVAELGLIALSDTQHPVPRLYALRDLQFRYFSAWNVDIGLLLGLNQLYAEQQTDWRLRIFSADCLARWFSSASYNPDVRDSGVQFVTGPTSAAVAAKLEDAVKQTAKHRKQRDALRDEFANLLAQEIEQLASRGKLKGESKVRLDKAMTQARLLGDRRFVPLFSAMANNDSLHISARWGAVDILGELADKKALPALRQYYMANKKGSYYDRRIALTAMYKIDSRVVQRFIKEALRNPVSDAERHDLEVKYLDYAPAQDIERTLGEHYLPLRAAIVRKDWRFLEKELRNDDGDISNTLVKYLTRTALLDSESRQAIAQLFDYIVSSVYASGSVLTLRMEYLIRAIEKYQSLFELSNEALSARRYALLRVLEKPGRFRGVHQYLGWSAIDVLASGRIAELQLSELLLHIGHPRFGKYLANRLDSNRRYSPGQIIRNLPANLDRRAASNVVRVLEGEGWDQLPEILAALDSRVIAIARAQQRSESVPFPVDKIGPYREVLSFQIIVEEILQGLPKSALPLLVDYIAGDSFRRPVSNIAETLKLTLAQNPVVTVPILNTLLNGGLSVSSRRFLRQVVLDQGSLALDGITSFLQSETPQRMAVVNDISASRAFRDRLTAEQREAVDKTISAVSSTLLIRRIKAAFTRVFVDEVIGFGMLVVLLTMFRRALFARLKAISAKLIELLRRLLIKLVKPSAPASRLWMPGFVVRAETFWQALQERALNTQQLEGLLSECTEAGPAVVDAIAAWAIRARQIPPVADLASSQSGLADLVAAILLATARQDPIRFQDAAKETTVAGTVALAQAREELTARYIKPRISALESASHNEAVAAAIKLELDRYSDFMGSA